MCKITSITLGLYYVRSLPVDGELRAAAARLPALTRLQPFVRRRLRIASTVELSRHDVHELLLPVTSSHV